MKDPIWVLREVVLAVHDEQLAEHGGLSGIRDEGLLGSALARPQNMVAYEARNELAKLAAAYLYGIVGNHPFADGNKRTALVTAELFLELNDYELTATDSECVITIIGVVDGTLSEEDLADWFEDNIQAT